MCAGSASLPGAHTSIVRAPCIAVGIVYVRGLEATRSTGAIAISSAKVVFFVRMSRVSHVAPNFTHDKLTARQQ